MAAGAAPDVALESEPAEECGLVLGPLLRYVGSTTATVWVETGILNAATRWCR